MNKNKKILYTAAFVLALSMLCFAVISMVDEAMHQSAATDDNAVAAMNYNNEVLPESAGTLYDIQNVEKLRTKLPLLVIETDGQKPTLDSFIDARFRLYNNGSANTNGIADKPQIDVKIGLKKRGFASYWNFGEKYAMKIELRDDAGNDLKLPVLNMPAESDWVLHSPYADKSLVRNYLAYNLAKDLRVYCPRIQYVELVYKTDLSDDLSASDYHGVYALVESIKKGKGRINIADFTTGDPDNSFETGGGYVISRDKLRDNETQFFESNKKDKISFVYPRYQDITYSQKKFIQKDFNKIEGALFSKNFKDPEKGYRKYIDLDSMIDYILLNEFTKNVDGYIFSTYMTRDVGGKLKMGPVWDFDVGMGNAEYAHNADPRDWYTFRLPWPSRLLQDQYFAKLAYQRWQELRQTVFSDKNISAIIDEAIATIGKNGIKRNFARWPESFTGYIWPNANPQTTTYDEEITRLKTFLTERGKWIDENFPVIIQNLESGVSPLPAKLFEDDQ